MAVQEMPRRGGEERAKAAYSLLLMLVEDFFGDERRARARRWTTAHVDDGRGGVVRKVRCWCVSLVEKKPHHLPLSRFNRGFHNRPARSGLAATASFNLRRACARARAPAVGVNDLLRPLPNWLTTLTNSLCC